MFTLQNQKLTNSTNLLSYEDPIANKRLLNDSFVRRLLPVSIPGYPNICTLQHTNNEASGRFLQLIVGLYKRRFPKYILKILLMSQQLFAGTKKE